MAERLLNFKTLSRIEMPLKNAAVAERGHVACLDTADGSLVPASVATTLIPIGLFEESLTGNGTTVIGVQLFQEVVCAVMINSGTGSVTTAHIGSNCYLHSAASEVSMTSSGKSIASRVMGIQGSGAGARVFVKMAS